MNSEEKKNLQDYWLAWGEQLDRDGFRKFTGTEVESEYPESHREWRAAKDRFLNPTESKKTLAGGARGVTVKLLREGVAMAERLLELEHMEDAKRRWRKAGDVMFTALERELPRVERAAARMAVVRLSIREPGRKPGILLRVNTPDNETYDVVGYEAAAKILNLSPASIRSQMARRQSYSAKKRATDGHMSAYGIRKMGMGTGTKNAVVQDACQKDENEGGEKTE